MTTRARDGWHWREWSAEALGTALLMFAVVSAKLWAVRSGVSDVTSRVMIVALVAGLVVVAIAWSPPGRRSGAHLNPAATFGFWLQQTVSAGDLVGYAAAQSAGAVAGVAAARIWGAGVGAPVVHWAVIAPRPDLAPSSAAAIEAGATWLILLVVYLSLTDPRSARLAAPLGGVALTLLVIGLAQVSGAGFNPVRGLGPDLWAGVYPAVWIYLAGPLIGAVLASATVLAFGRRPLTGKLRHDPTIPCAMRCALPHTHVTHREGCT